LAAFAFLAGFVSLAGLAGLAFAAGCGLGFLSLARRGSNGADAITDEESVVGGGLAERWVSGVPRHKTAKRLAATMRVRLVRAAI